MGKPTNPPGQADGEDIQLTIDDRGRVTLPKELRDRLGIEPNQQIPARVVGSVLQITPKPSSELEPAKGQRRDWEGSTPVDAEALFGSIDDADK
jgi:AbrB family looped-hinge helix DNA binding protein